MSCSLAPILHVSDLRKSCSGNTEHLRCLLECPIRSRRRLAGDRGGGTDSEHDPVRDKSFERNTHGGNCNPILGEELAHALRLVHTEGLIPKFLVVLRLIELPSATAG